MLLGAASQIAALEQGNGERIPHVRFQVPFQSGFECAGSSVPNL